MSQTVIEVKDLCKYFILHQQGGIRIDALDSINFSVHAGECVALYGPSGAGKSTLLKTLYGNYLPTSGSILVHCPGGVVDIAKADPRTVSMLRHTCISYDYQIADAGVFMFRIKHFLPPDAGLFYSVSAQ